jgi:hypothetical protein
LFLRSTFESLFKEAQELVEIDQAGQSRDGYVKSTASEESAEHLFGGADRFI